MGFVDADWAADLDDRRSFTGYVFKYADGPIAWESRKQRTVALSSAEAEYMALSDSTKEALFLRSVYKGIVGPLEEPTVLFNDNQSAQCIANNDIINGRTKHIDVRHHMIRDHIDNKDIAVKYLNTELMVADILTKPVNRLKNDFCVKGLGLLES